MESGVFFHRVYNNDVSISGRGSAHDDDGFGEEDCGASFAGRRKFEFVSHLDLRERKRDIHFNKTYLNRLSIPIEKVVQNHLKCNQHYYLQLLVSFE